MDDGRHFDGFGSSAKNRHDAGHSFPQIWQAREDKDFNTIQQIADSRGIAPRVRSQPAISSRASSIGTAIVTTTTSTRATLRLFFNASWLFGSSCETGVPGRWAPAAPGLYAIGPARPVETSDACNVDQPEADARVLDSPFVPSLSGRYTAGIRIVLPSTLVRRALRSHPRVNQPARFHHEPVQPSAR